MYIEDKCGHLIHVPDSSEPYSIQNSHFSTHHELPAVHPCLPFFPSVFNDPRLIGHSIKRES